MECFVETARATEMTSGELFSSPYDFVESCCLCGVSSGIRLTKREERVGCLISPISYCYPCLETVIAEEKERSYRRNNFCNLCESKFKRPYYKNRKRLTLGSRYTSYSLLLCSNCHYRESMFRREQEVIVQPLSPADNDFNFY
jgi:hypothetical protein